MTDRDMLRHTLATLAYRAGKALRDAPDDFGGFRIGDRTRTPTEIVAHMADLLRWALAHARGDGRWESVPPADWQRETVRFYGGLAELDAYLASDAALECPAEKLLQGPLSDALHHVGQIAMLRRLAGAPVKGENYFAAEVRTGRVGEDQASPRREFD